jgi:hypothetical protein
LQFTKMMWSNWVEEWVEVLLCLKRIDSEWKAWCGVTPY